MNLNARTYTLKALRVNIRGSFLLKFGCRRRFILKATEWLSRGNQSLDPFDALSNYWRAFNGLFAGNGRERDLISRFLQQHIDESFARTLIQEQIINVKVLIKQPVIDMRGNARNTSIYMRQFQLARAELDKLVALFMIIYQVRCNFEHGQKSPSHKRDRSLCIAAGPIVAAVVEHSK
jgi:hypothetical protein